MIYKVNLYEIILALSKASELMVTQSGRHHLTATYIALRIGIEMEMPLPDLKDLVLSSMIHDIGVTSIDTHESLMSFEIRNAYQHARFGAMLLEDFFPFSNVSEIIRYHHIRWDDLKELEDIRDSIPLASFIVHLADRVTVLLVNNSSAEDAQARVNLIEQTIRSYSGGMFSPDVVAVFLKLSAQKDFWEDVASPSEAFITSRIDFQQQMLDEEDLHDLAKVFSRLVDFRSEYTATHSAGVAVCAEYLGRLAGLPEQTCYLLRIAGYLHDLGKIAVSRDLLEKPTLLTDEEYTIIKQHALYTHMILKPLVTLGALPEWAAFHHEKLNGSGYPYQLKAEQLTTEMRILTISDIFSALNEDRPYQKGLSKRKVCDLMNEMVCNEELDMSLVALLKRNYDQINTVRELVQMKSSIEYQAFLRQLYNPLLC